MQEYSQNLGVFCGHVTSVYQGLARLLRRVLKNRAGRPWDRGWYITAIHRPSRKLRGGICRYETFWMRIFERTTFLLLRCRSIHVKLYVLVTYSEFKVVAQTMHSGVTHERCADFRHGKKNRNGANL